MKTEAESIDANLPSASYDKVMQSGFPCRVTLDLPAGEYLLRLGVRDTNTGLLGTANAQIAIPSSTSEHAN